jgi:tetratricopeptide (TPR) repeat protein
LSRQLRLELDRGQTRIQPGSELKPDYAVAHHWYAFIFLAAFGRLDEAIAEMQSSLSLDPLSLPVGSNIGLVLYLARRNEEALAHFQA